MTKVKALRMEQQGKSMYVTALTLRQITAHEKVDYWSEKNSNGYQRPLKEKRLGEVVDFLLEEDGIFPTNVVLSARADGPGLRFDPDGHTDAAAQVGTLTI